MSHKISFKSTMDDEKMRIAVRNLTERTKLGEFLKLKVFGEMVQGERLSYILHPVEIFNIKRKTRSVLRVLYWASSSLSIDNVICLSISPFYQLFSSSATLGGVALSALLLALLFAYGWIGS